MTKKKLIVLTSGDGSNLQAIINQIENDQINGSIEAVLSNKDSFSLVRAKKHQIPAIYLSHKNYASREIYDQALIDKISPFNPDLIILAGFMRILTPLFIQAFKNKIINVHPSLLPKYKGLNTHKQALENNDQEHGTSIHLVNEELDAGMVIAQAKLAVKPNDTVSSLEQRIKVLEYQLYPEVIRKLCNGELNIQDQK
ncbi:phosphoribosylglycinamide formyltransferase [Thiotrichales bacterium 19S3-7]|nr:phosphoribosylglycinamide formyltransferase [Thiotrichales bacterium 19S3-7]MCF6801810.1 phosphoribosylglycinamide formyltransferase [Thiotrichales bacterium 19S3-11]